MTHTPIARHRGGLTRATAETARDCIARLADAVASSESHLRSGCEEPCPLARRGLTLTVQQSHGTPRRDDVGATIMLHEHGRLVCEMRMEGPLVVPSSDLHAHASSAAAFADACIESAAQDPAPLLVRDSRSDHAFPDELVSAWNAVGELAGQAYARTCASPNGDPILATVIGESDLSDMRIDLSVPSFGAKLHCIDSEPSRVKGLTVPGGIAIAVSHRDDGISMRFSAHAHRVHLSGPDTMRVLRAEADLARFRETQR